MVIYFIVFQQTECLIRGSMTLLKVPFIFPKPFLSFQSASYVYQGLLSSLFHGYTVKPVLSGHRIKRPPSIKRTVAEVPKFISLIYFK